MTSAAQSLSGIVCLALLVWPSVLMGFLLEESAAYVRGSEMRPPAELPALELGRALDEDFYGAVSASMRDHLPLRASIIGVRNIVDLRLFGAERFGDVEIGSHGWLYYGPSLAGLFEDEETTRTAIELLRALLAQHAKDGPPLLFMVAPDKHTVHPEHLSPGSIRQIAPSLPMRELLRSAVREVPAQSIDTWQLFADERLRTGRDMYWQLDTHWNRFGQVAVTRAIVRHFDALAWTEDSINILREIKRGGDLARMVNAGIPRVADVKITLRGRKQEVTKTKLDYEKPSAHFETSSSRHLVPGRTLFLHDSFGVAMWWLIPGYFEDLTCIHIANLDRQSFADLSASHDRIIFQVVERQAVYALRRLLGEGDVPLEPLADELAAGDEDEDSAGR